MKIKKIVLPLVASSLISVHVSNAADNTIETITVLGESAKQGANLGGVELTKLPLNAHVVGAEEIERIRFVDPDELLDRIPGETQVRSLRIPNGAKGYTLAFVDGVPIENPYEGATQRLDRVNTADIQRVEVIKGPTSALFPNNVFGGVVNVVSRDVPAEFEGQTSVEFGNFGRRRLGLNLGSSVGDFGYFLDVNQRRLDGLREGTQNDRDQASLKLSYVLGDNTKFVARLEQLEEVFAARGDLTAAQIAEDPKQAGKLSQSTEFDQQSTSLTVEHQLSTGVVNATVLRRVKESTGISRFRGPQEYEDTGDNVQLKYHHNLDAGSLIIGLDSYRGDRDTRAFGRRDFSFQGPFRASSQSRDIDAYFAQYQTELFDDFTMTAGVRHESIKLASTVFKDQGAKFSVTAPKLGFNYDLGSNQQLWFSVSEGLYAPDLDDLFDKDNGNPNLKPEESRNIELGLRGFVGNWAYDTSIYQNKIDNYLFTQELVDANGDEFEITSNASQVTVKGIESVIEYAIPQSSWRLGVTHTFAINKYDSFVQSTPGARDDLSGKYLSRSPKHHLNARVAWEPLNNFTVELEGDFYSSYFADAENAPEAKFKRDERLNLRLTYDRQNWRFWVNMLNLTDTLEDRATFRRGTMKFRTIDGRSYYAGLAYSF